MSRRTRARAIALAGHLAGGRALAGRFLAFCLLAGLVLGGLLFTAPRAAARVVPEGSPEPVWLEISGKPYGYFALTAESPLRFAIEGPATFEPILRWRFEEGSGRVDVDVEFRLDGASLWHQVFRPLRGTGTYVDHPGATAGEALRVPIDIPGGTHVVEILLLSPDSGTLDVSPVMKPPAVLPYKLAWRVEAGAAYDSNIFRYADSDVDDFLDGVNADRYEAEYMDDVRLEPSVDLSLVRERPGKSVTELRLSVDGRFATLNPEKSFLKVGGRLKESYEDLGYGLLGYYAIPKYHIRDLWDPDAPAGDRYRPCEFRQHALLGELGTNGSLPVDLIARAKFDYMGYNQDFVEYDSYAWTWGIVAIARPVRGVRVDLGYALRVLDARGYDEEVEEDGVSDDSDIDYEQNEYVLKVRWDVGHVFGARTALTFRARLADRYYQTGKSAEDDPYHAGREDTYWTLSAGSSHRISDGLTLEAFYEHRLRSSESAYLEDIGIDKDYSADRVGLRLVFEGERILD